MININFSGVGPS